MRTTISVLMCGLLLACSSKEKQFKKELAMGRCDSALINLPQHDPMVKLANTSEQAAGTVLSYAFVGASYTAEVLWDVAGGTVMVVALCSPTLLLATAAVMSRNVDFSGHPEPVCFPGKVSALGAPPLGRQAVAHSKPLRCPDLKSLSRSMRGVAACYEGQGAREDLEKAEKTLTALKDSEDFYACLPAKERELVDQQLLGIQVKKSSAF